MSVTDSPRLDALVDRLRGAIRQHQVLAEREQHATVEVEKLRGRVIEAQYAVNDARRELEEFLASHDEVPPMEVRRTVAERRYGGAA